MKNVYILIVIIIMNFSISYSQYGWYKQNFSGSVQFSDVCFIDTQTGWVSGSTSLYKTTNSGKLWSSIKTNIGSIQGIYFYNNLNGYAMSNTGITGDGIITIQKTTDGGITWKPTTYNSGEKGFGFWTMNFRNQNLGSFVGGGQTDFNSRGAAATTHDGGNSWNVVLIDSIGYASGSFFSDNNNGWFVTVLGYIYKTRDGGSSWNKQYKDNNGNSLWSVYFIDSKHGWVGGIGGKIYYTDDGGIVWNDKNINKSVTINSIYFADINNGWLATDDGIFATNDGGNSWTAQEIEDGNTSLLKLYFVDKKNGWAVGNNIILNTNSGGDKVTRIIASIQIDGDTLICNGDSLMLTADPIVNGYTYQWSTGEKTTKIYAKQTGTYKVVIKAQDGSMDSASINVAARPKPPITLIGDTTLCTGGSTKLSVKEIYFTYDWSTGEDMQSITISKPGKYSVTIMDTNGCFSKAEFNIIDKGISTLFKDIKDICCDSTKINSLKDTMIIIKNNSAWDYRITGITIKYDTSTFKIKLYSQQMPITVAKEFELIFGISFLPSEERKYIDSIIITSDLPCQEGKRIQIQGVGLTNTGVKDFIENEKMEFYPNPTSDFIDLPKSLINSEISIYSTLGIEVFRMILYSNRIDISSLSPDIYFLKAGNKFYKFVKI